jgi:NTE family protein
LNSGFQHILSTVPIFTFLGRNEIAAVESLFVESTHQKGELICREGEEGDTFHIVLDGELEVFVGSDESQRLVAILSKGDFFGEMALLQAGKRTASVIVARRAHLVTLDRASFSSLFMKNPKALEYFTRVLCKRVADANKGDTVRKSTMAISISSTRPSLRGKTMLARALAAVLSDITGSQVLVVHATAREGDEPRAVIDVSDGLDQAVLPLGEGVFTLDVPARSGLAPDYYAERGSDLISRFASRFPFIIFDINAEPRGLAEAVELFSDVQLEISDTATLDTGPSEPTFKRYRVINLFNSSSRPVSICRCEPFVLPHDHWLIDGDSTHLIRTNPRSSLGLPIHRLARKILGATVGVALGGGAAFGIAHLGVLRTLEKHGIPIDLIAGCSQGSIIGVGYAAGVSIKRMIDIALDLGHWKNSWRAVDPTITRPGFLLGNKFVKIFEPHLGEMRTFSDLLMPCMTVATNVETGASVPIGSGLLTTAFRASAAVPMVFSPIKIGDQVLVDGGVSDPVPAEVVNAMGADLCIAVNVVPPPKMGVENAISKVARMVNFFNPVSYLNGDTGMPPMFDIIMNSMQVLQHELGTFKAISADVLIKPDLSDFTWIEYYRSNELIERGEEAAERAMPAIERALKHKLAPSQARQPATAVAGK